jgi:NADH-quinone oxidoreductase subunit G
MRIKPRYNPDVNQWWICDRGRFDFKFHDLDRIEAPALRKGAELEPGDWNEALDRAAGLLQSAIAAHGPASVGVILSPQMSTEELIYAHALFVKGLGLQQVAFRNPWEAPGPEDDLLMKADRNPNSWTAERLGFAADAGNLLKQAASGAIKVLFVVRHDLAEPEALEQLSQAAAVIYLGTNWNAAARLAQVVLAGATHGEKCGTFVNFEGRAQRFQQALLPFEESRDDLEILAGLAERLKVGLPESPESALSMWLGVTPEDLGSEGMIVAEALQA